MSRVIVLALEIGLLLSTLCAMLYSVRIIIEQTLGGSWYWGGAMAAFAAPVAFAAALFLFERRKPRSPERENAK